jgi:hypothetical protein
MLSTEHEGIVREPCKYMRGNNFTIQEALACEKETNAERAPEEAHPCSVQSMRALCESRANTCTAAL